MNEEREGSSVAMTNELQRLRSELAVMRANMLTMQHNSGQSSHSVQSSVQSRCVCVCVCAYVYVCTCACVP